SPRQRERWRPRLPSPGLTHRLPAAHGFIAPPTAGPRSWRRPPLAHATPLHPWNQGTCEDADVGREVTRWPRRSARSIIASRDAHRRGTLQWYMLQASSTSAGPPIVDGRCRPLSGERPTGTDRCIATALCDHHATAHVQGDEVNMGY